MLRKYRKSFIRAVIAAFPQIGLERSKFLNVEGMSQYYLNLHVPTIP
jgi:hypothetical protein